MAFSVTIGKDKATVKILVGNILSVTYQGENVVIQPDNNGRKVTWKRLTGKLDDKIVQKIGKAIEKHIQSSPK